MTYVYSIYMAYSTLPIVLQLYFIDCFWIKGLKDNAGLDTLLLV